MTDEKEESLAPAILQNPEAGTAVAMQRADTEVKAALLMARQFPRDEHTARLGIIKACQRASFAKDAVYSFRRGGAQITGPSVDLAREAARLWGNIDHSMRVISKDLDYIHVSGTAVDLQTNVRSTVEDKFRRLVQRSRGWVEPDERDERELTNRRAAMCVRNAILQILPADLVEDALEEANKTTLAVARKELKEQPEERIKKMVTLFSDLGVTVEMLEKKLNHALSLTTAEELVTLQQTYKSIKAGNSTRDKEFDVPGPPSEGKARTLDALFTEKVG